MGDAHLSRRLWLGSAILGLLLGADPVTAGSDINRFRPPMTLDGTLGLDTSEGLFPWQLSFAGYFTYTDRPLVWRYSDGTYEPIIGQQLTLDLVAAAGAGRRVDVAVALPIILMQKGPNQATFDGLPLAGAGVGDLRVVPRLTLLRERGHGVGLAFLPELTFPTGNAGRFQGDPRVSFRPRAVGTLPLHRFFPARIMAMLGYNWRRNETVGDEPTLGDELVIGDEWLYGLGLQVDFERYGVPVIGVAELCGMTGATSPFSANGLSAAEVLVGARTRLFADWVATVGVGGGISRGLGASAWRLILGAAWAPLPPDRDGDGIPDAVDACQEQPEDYDQFEDEDGCPETDNDGDGIADEHDRCPTIPEDRNGVEDGDGCPDTGPRDQDGDGIPDDDDRCPTDPEDIDEFEDFDGCPDSDHDHDGVPNNLDQCPEEREVINGVDDGDGCPDEGEGVTEYVADERIEIKETILFESGKATIKEQSTRVLDQVALQILAHPEIGKIRIEGHTDSLGNDEDNLYLSQDRADAVRRYLVNKGVSKTKLEAEGFGETMPIDTNDTAAGRSRNRRVEFVIVGSK
jgi:outer membrane protein OmpA-like peptidoglycan-associated protein